MPSAKVTALRDARALLTEPTAWTRGTLARDSRGADVGPNDDEAACWCLWGALYAVTLDELAPGDSKNEDYHAAAQVAKRKAGRTLMVDAAEVLRMAGAPQRLGEWNDHPDTTHADILAAFDRAIEAAA